MEKEIKRCANFTSREKDILLSLVQKYFKCLENKKNNAVFNKQKQECWEKLAWEFNSSQTSGFRTGMQLKSLYEQMKKLAKQHKSDEKLEVFKTGGGNYTSKVTSQDEKVLSMLEENFFTIPNNFDSNAAENVAGPSRIQPMMVDIEDTNENIMVIYEEDEEEAFLENEINLKRTEHKKEIKGTDQTETIEEEPVPKKQKLDDAKTPQKYKKSMPSLIKNRLEISEKKLNILKIMEETEKENLRGKKIDNEIKEIIKERELLELKIKKIKFNELNA
ncbi:unnamed protein product [Psylliodes chrysocephalus]|uniref:Regulatory protein zeste n=1 Tax=Psylliodes chrysocephalus TaxID=3402493 RepID=A0A9P0G403_9CUCU|nr:unnamed protein product [Psylliodes chrysocephala]